MPIFEYRCKGCSQVSERLVRHPSQEMTECVCGNPVEKIFSRPVFRNGPIVNHYPPPSYQPFTEPVVTRDWLNPDGTTRPMKKDEWIKSNVPGLEV